MIIEPDFLTHWKLKALISAVGKAEALKALLSLWAHCQRRKAWEFQLTPLMLAGICDFEGEAQKLWDAMKELVWIEPAEELGWFRVHDWDVTNASLIGRWAGGLRKTGAGWHARGYATDPPSGASGGSTSGQAKVVKAATSGSSDGSASGPTDLIGLDRIGLEGKSTPKAPKGAGTLPMPADWSPGRVTTMEKWLDYRSRIKKAVRAPSWPALQAKVAVLDDAALEACVNESISNSWIGLFPERFTPSPPTGPGPGAAVAQKKEGGGAEGAKKITPSDFPWRSVAVDIEGWTPVGEWEDQTARSRRNLRETWLLQSAATKAALCALTQDGSQVDGDDEVENGEKKERGAAAE